MHIQLHDRASFVVWLANIRLWQRQKDRLEALPQSTVKKWRSMGKLLHFPSWNVS